MRNCLPYTIFSPFPAFLALTSNGAGFPTVGLSTPAPLTLHLDASPVGLASTRKGDRGTESPPYLTPTVYRPRKQMNGQEHLNSFSMREI